MLRIASSQDFATFCQNLDNAVLMQRAMAIVKQRRLAQATRALGGHNACDGVEYKADIHADYYFAKMFEEREAGYQSDPNYNAWSDEGFLDYQLRKNDALRPAVNKNRARVAMGGIIVPSRQGGFHATVKGNM